jgi:DNA-binding beta-propeller fold protein YncE
MNRQLTGAKKASLLVIALNVLVLSTVMSVRLQAQVAVGTLSGRVTEDLGYLITRAHVSTKNLLDPPKFEVDPSWPKPLPNRWVTGDVAGTCVDSQDHVFIVSRANLSAKEQQIATPAPPVIEFDQDGKVVNSWGDPKVIGARFHGCFVDYQGNVWIGGTEDGVIQKYSHDGGKLLLQIGTKGTFDTSDGTSTGAPMNSSHVFLNKPSGVAVDPANGDVYISDGYGNRRIVVFDREGHFLREWGQQGTKAQTEAGVGGVFFRVVHCAVMGNDGFVYVCDRNGGRIEVFDKMGNFQRNILIRSKFASLSAGSDAGSPAWIAFSPDPAQKFMYVATGDEDVWIIDHATWQTLATFGQPGHQVGEFDHVHSLSVNSKGDIITGETTTGRRVQMFRLVGK